MNIYSDFYPAPKVFWRFETGEMFRRCVPYMLSGAVIDELLNLLSNETIGVLDDFSEKLFGIDIPQGLILV